MCYDVDNYGGAKIAMRKKRVCLNPKLKLVQEGQSYYLSRQYLLITFFWIIFTGMLIYILYVLINERKVMNESPEIQKLLAQLQNKDLTSEAKELIYSKMIALQHYPIIDFSLMKFHFFSFGTNSTVSAEATWKDLQKNMNLAYSYIFISAAIAVVALFFYLLINFRILKQRLIEKKYELSTVYQNNYVIFSSKMYADAISNLGIIFCFFNFATTIIAVIYGIINVVVATLNRLILRFDSPAFLKKNWWKSENFVFFTSVLIIQNTYTLLKSYFAAAFEIDIDILMAIIMPIGTITVIIAIFIRNMLNSKITSVKKAVKTIMTRVRAFKIYVNSQEEAVFNDYNFMNDMPAMIKERFFSKAITNKQGLHLLKVISETIDFLRLNVKKTNELNYLLLHIFNNVQDLSEIEEIKYNILKLKNK